MPKVDVWSRPASHNDSKVFKFAAQRDGTEYEFVIKPIGPIEEAEIYDKTQALIALYLGDPLKNEPPRMAFPLVGGKSVKLTKRAIIVAVQLEVMQPEDDSVRYKFEELIALAATDGDVFNALVDAAFTYQEECEAGKHSAGDSATS